MMKFRSKPLVSLLLVLALLCSLLASCRPGKKPKESDAQAIARVSESLFALLKESPSFTVSGSYSLHSSTSDSLVGGITDSDAGELFGTLSVSGGSLSASLTVSGSREIDGESLAYSDLYQLCDGELRYMDAESGLLLDSLALSELLPLLQTAKAVEATLTLLPYLRAELDAVLLSGGARYTADDLIAFLTELASLYRSFLLRVGEGQVLILPETSGDSAKVLAEYGSVILEADGTKSICFTLPLDSLFAALTDRVASLGERGIGEAIDGIFGNGSEDKILAAVASCQSGETLGALFARLEAALCAKDGDLLRILSATAVLFGAPDLLEIVSSLTETDALTAFRMLTGDPTLSADGTRALLSTLFAMTPSELFVSLGKSEDPMVNLLSLSGALQSSTLSITLPYKASGTQSVRISYSFSGATDYGYAAKSLSLTLTPEN